MSRPYALRILFAALLLVAVVVPSTGAETGPDYVTSDNVKLIERIKTPGDGVGARVVGPYMYVTTTKSLSIFDIKSDPEHPKQIGQDTMDVEFENEEVPTNGKWLGISGQIGCPDPTASNVTNTSGNGTGGTGSGSNATGCLTGFDVSDPANPKRLTSIAGAGQHTSTCLLDCTWIYGSTGAISDNRDPAHAKLVGDWMKAMPNLYTDPKTGEKKKFGATCHHLREIQPGIILGSCQPFVLMSVRPEDGGSVMKPVVLDIGTNTDNRFIHSNRWPREGRDKFVLVGGETNGHPSCDDTAGAFMVWDASDVIDGNGGFNSGKTFKEVSEIRPQSGNYADGKSPYNGLGCSVHWFEEHPSFNNGGLVALAEYENGTHFLQITASGKIIDKDFFLPLGGSTSAPHWNPYDPTVVYSIDYARGVDVLKYTGPTFVPPAEPAAEPPAQTTTAPSSPGAPCAEGAGFKSVGAKRSGRRVRFSAGLLEGKSFDLTLFQVSHGRKLLNKRVARYKARKGAVTFSRKRLSEGRYVARFATKTAGGQTDARVVALRRQGGRWVTTQPFALPPCGVFTSFALSGPAFGGSKSRPLTISYALRRGANSVRLEAFAGRKLVKRFTGGGAAGRTYRFKLAAKGLKRGTLIRVRATVSQGSPVPAQTVYSRRI